MCIPCKHDKLFQHISCCKKWGDVWKLAHLCRVGSALYREQPSRSDFGFPFTPPPPQHTHLFTAAGERTNTGQVSTLSLPFGWALWAPPPLPRECVKRSVSHCKLTKAFQELCEPFLTVSSGGSEENMSLNAMAPHTEGCLDWWVAGVLSSRRLAGCSVLHRDRQENHPLCSLRVTRLSHGHSAHFPWIPRCPPTVSPSAQGLKRAVATRASNQMVSLR